MATPVTFYLNCLHLWAISQYLRSPWSWIAISHNLSYMPLERKATGLTLGPSLPCSLNESTGSSQYQIYILSWILKMFVLSDKINSTAKELFEENLLSSHF